MSRSFTIWGDGEGVDPFLLVGDSLTSQILLRDG